MATEAILTKPLTTDYAPFTPDSTAAYRAAVDAWESQRDNAAPYWSPYTGLAGAYDAAWTKAKAWIGREARVTKSDGTARRGVVSITTANAPNGTPGIAVSVFDGFSDQWCGAGFLHIEEAE